jgi:hypothetical protein
MPKLPARNATDGTIPESPFDGYAASLIRADLTANVARVLQSNFKERLVSILALQSFQITGSVVPVDIEKNCGPSTLRVIKDRNEGD